MIIINPFRSAWDSRQIPGYLADFDARYGVTLDGSSNVSQWDERYSNGMSFSNATSGQRPAQSTSSWNSVPALQGNVANSVNLGGNVAATGLFQNGSACSIYLIGGQKASSSQASWFLNASIHASASTRLQFGNSTGNAISGGGRGLDADGAVAVTGPLGYGPYIQPMSQIIDYVNKTARIYKNGVLVAQNTSFESGVNTSNSTSAFINLMSTASASAGFLNGEIHRMLICSQAHTDAQQAAVWEALKTEYSGTGLLPTLGLSPSLIVQMHGDSITQGNILTYPTPTLPDRVWQSLGSTGSKMVVNLGRSGSTTTTASTDRPNQVDILPVSTATKVVYVLFVGTNDIATSATGATTYNNIKTIFQAALTARPSIKVIICTPIARAGALTGGQRTQLVALQSAINTNAVADGAHAVCDLGAITQFLTSSSTLPNDTTYYSGDGIHPNDTGNLILASALATTINSV